MIPDTIPDILHALNGPRHSYAEIPDGRGRLFIPTELDDESRETVNQAKMMLERRQDLVIGGFTLKRVADVKLNDLREHLMSFDALAACAWRGGGLAVIASFDFTHHGVLLHASISHRARYPTWDEIRQMRYELFPSPVDAMMILPRAGHYVNLHENTFHLFSTPVGWNIL